MDRTFAFSAGLLVGWGCLFFYNHDDEEEREKAPMGHRPEASRPSVAASTSAVRGQSSLDKPGAKQVEQKHSRTPIPIQSLLTRYQFPTVDYHTLEFSESLAEDLQLTPEQTTATQAIWKRTLESLKELEKKHVTIEVNNDGDQTLVIDPFDSTLVLDALDSELAEALDPERKDLLKSLIANDRLFGRFGQRRQKIHAQNVINNQGNDPREIPVIVIFDSIDEQGQYISESRTLTEAMYLKRYGELVAP